MLDAALENSVRTSERSGSFWSCSSYLYFTFFILPLTLCSPNILVTSFLYPGGRLALVVVRVPTWGEDLVTMWCRDPGTSTGSKQSDRTLDVESIDGVECVSRVCYGGGPLVRVVVQ